MALYRAKNEGRRRACIYDAEMDSPTDPGTTSAATSAVATPPVST
jgi:hypothetical protein